MNNDCTIYKTTEFIGKRWTLLILLELYKGDFKKKRYSELKNSLDRITPKILSTRLKELAKEGMIKKDIDASKFPIKCEYSLTESGMDFIKIIKDMKKWALKWNVQNKVCSESNCKNCEF
jgi:DNA-binding HxlR family transcriptional regulator